MSKDAPYAAPIVCLNEGTVAHLLAWEFVEVTGAWIAWVSWIRQSGGGAVHMVVQAGAAAILPLESAEKYELVPRRVRGRDGAVRPWSGEIG